MKRRLVEGICFSYGMNQCPDKCSSFNENALQFSLYSFEIFGWVWDSRCLMEQKKHLKLAKEMVKCDEMLGKQTFNIKNCSEMV